MAAQALPLENPIDFFNDPRFRTDPYPIYRELRRNQPVLWLDVVRGWILTRHEDMSAVLRSPRFRRRTRIRAFLGSGRRNL